MNHLSKPVSMFNDIATAIESSLYPNAISEVLDLTKVEKVAFYSFNING